MKCNNKLPISNNNHEAFYLTALNNKKEQIKQIIFLLTVVFSMQLISAQNFETTKKYKVTTSLQDKGSEYLNTTFNIMNSQEEFERFSTFTIKDEEFYEEMTITALENPGLEGVAEVVKVEVESTTCCTAVEAYYFLVTKDKNFIPLPSLENLYCDDSGQDIHYVFPSQVFGKEGTILKTKMSYTKTYDIQNVSILQQFSWNDDDFENDDYTASNSEY